MRKISSTTKAYLAGFMDGDGSIYVRLKPNPTYKYGFQVAPYIVFFQSSKNKINFEKVCSLINIGYIRERKDGIMEFIISKNEDIKKFLKIVKPYSIMKKEQVELMSKILDRKEKIKDRKDFQGLMKLIDRFRDLNYSKKRKLRALTP